MLFHIKTDLIFLYCLTVWEKDVRDMSSAVWVQYFSQIYFTVLSGRCGHVVIRFNKLI